LRVFSVVCLLPTRRVAKALIRPERRRRPRSRRRLASGTAWEVSTAEIVAVPKEANEAGNPETARRMRTVIGEVFRYAMQHAPVQRIAHDFIAKVFLFCGSCHSALLTAAR